LLNNFCNKNIELDVTLIQKHHEENNTSVQLNYIINTQQSSVSPETADNFVC